MPTPAAHAEWVRAAIRDHLGLTDCGGLVSLDGAGLAELAEVARRATLNWPVSAARTGDPRLTSQGRNRCR